MNRTILPLLALLAASCGRDLKIVEPPTPPPVVDEGLPAPALLGTLSGDWVLEASLPIDGTAPAGWVRLLHLVDPRGVEEDRVLGFSLFGAWERRLVAPSYACGAFVDAGYEGVAVDGTVKPFDCAGTPLPPREFHGARVAGVAGLTSDLTMQVCPGGPARPLRARRACVFNASISGVYQGRSIACDGTETEFQLGLGFTGAEVAGWLHPWGRWTINGSYDPFGGGGVVELRDAETDETQCGSFTLRPVGGTLALGLDVWAAEEQPLPDGSTRRACAAKPDGCGLRRIEVTRLEGGETESCDPSVFARELRADSRVVRAGDERFVDVRIYDASAGGAALPPGSVKLSLLRATDGLAATQVGTSEGVTARFALGDDACGLELVGWELFAAVQDEAGSNLAVAQPSCVFLGPLDEAEPNELDACLAADARSADGLVCLEVKPGEFSWLRPCDSSADCPLANTTCFAYMGFPVCFWSGCGASALIGEGTNGAVWEPCNAELAQLTEEGPAADGLCLPTPDGSAATCQLDGRREAGSLCRLDGGRSQANLCEAGSLCVPSSTPAQPAKRCGCDADCLGETPRAVCDPGSSQCVALGTCAELCDVGGAPIEPGTQAACTNGGTCTALGAVPFGATHALGVCR